MSEQFVVTDENRDHLWFIAESIKDQIWSALGSVDEHHQIWSALGSVDEHLVGLAELCEEFIEAGKGGES